LEDVSKGTILWAFEATNTVPIVGYEAKENIIHSEDELKLFPPNRIKSILHGGFYIGLINKFAELLDGNNFSNHSKDNTMESVA
jgi:hypothetical protein